MLTLAGFLCSTLAFLLVLTFGTSKAPLLTSFLLFAYQTLDGTDGKHARNTRSGSPIGEVVDHGVDAIVTSWYVYIVLDLFPSFSSPTMCFLFLTCSQVAFVTSQLTLLHLGKQFMGEFDSQESQVLIQCLLVLRSFGLDGFLFGSHTSIPILFGLSLMDLFGWCIVLNLFRALFESTYAIYAHYLTSSRSSSNGETMRSFQYQLGLLLFFVFLSWMCRERLEFMQWFFLSAFSIADISNHVLVCRIVKEPTPWFHSGLVVMMFAVLIGKDNGVIAGWIFPLIMACLHLRYVVPRCVLFAKLLGVNVLTVVKK